LLSGFFPAALLWALALLAIFSNVTAIERIIYVWHITSQAAGRQKANTAAESRSFAGQLNQLDGHDGLRPASKEDLHTTASPETNEVTDPSVRPVPSRVPPFPGGVQE
jgi:CDP-diacylglycerol--glycerol-3-phosphate 3-phosphatidyltransferase